MYALSPKPSSAAELPIISGQGRYPLLNLSVLLGFIHNIVIARYIINSFDILVIHQTSIVLLKRGLYRRTHVA